MREKLKRLIVYTDPDVDGLLLNKVTMYIMHRNTVPSKCFDMAVAITGGHVDSYKLEDVTL